MNKTNIVKLSLDLVMGIVFALLFNKMAVAGLAFHEIVGLAIGLAFIWHTLLNWKWVKTVTLKFFSREIPFRTKFSYLIVFLLVVSMIYIMVSGVLISRILFPSLGYGSSHFMEMTHFLVSRLSLILLGIHIGLRWEWVMSTVKRIFSIPKNTVLNGIAITAVVLVLAFGAFSIVATDFVPKVAGVGTVVNQGELYDRSKAGDFDEFEGREGFRGEGNFSGDLPRKGFRGEREEGFAAHEEGFGERGEIGTGAYAAITFITLFVNLGILGFFTAITYYLDKWIYRRKARNTAK